MLFPEARGMLSVMNYLFSHGDLDGGAMPSSHVAGALIVVIYTYKYLRRWFWAVLGLFVPMVFSTVYNSYHYATDVIAGLIAGWTLYWIGRAAFRAVHSFLTV
jgi:membrane-associated phospholipid phosphatase